MSTPEIIAPSGNEPEPTLFALEPCERPVAPPPGRPRLRRAERHQDRYGTTPAEFLVDGGFAQLEAIEQVSSAALGTTVYAPLQKTRKEGRDPYQPLAGDSEAIAAWRRRMGTAQAQTIYQERAATAECVNAISRNRGLHQSLVRGLQKARTVVLWFVLAHNLMRAVALRAQAALATVGG